MQTEHEIRLLSRVAGLLCLVIIACGIGSEMFIRGSLLNKMDISVTAANILTDSVRFKVRLPEL
jgi:hypothetical protein